MKILPALLVFLFSSIVQAETQTVTAEASYTIEDGEAPSSADFMLTPKTKQAPLQEAATSRQGHSDRINRHDANLSERLVSGEELIQQARSDKKIMDSLVEAITGEPVLEDWLAQEAKNKNKYSGRAYIVQIGSIRASALQEASDGFELYVPVTIRVSNAFLTTVSKVARQLGGRVRQDVKVNLNKIPCPDRSGCDFYGQLRIGSGDSAEALVTLVRMGRNRETVEYFQKNVGKHAFMVSIRFGSHYPEATCILGPTSDVGWFLYRRIFPVAQIIEQESSNHIRIENGQYELDDRFLSVECDKESQAVGVRGEACKDLQKRIKRRKDDPGKDGYVAIVHKEATFDVVFKIDSTRLAALSEARVDIRSDVIESILFKDKNGKESRGFPPCYIAH